MELQEAVIKVANLIEVVVNAKHESSPGGTKIDVVEYMPIINACVDLGPILLNIKPLRESIINITDEQKANCVVAFEVAFDIAEDEAEAKFERTAKYVIETGDFILDFMKKK